MLPPTLPHHRAPRVHVLPRHRRRRLCAPHPMAPRIRVLPRLRLDVPLVAVMTTVGYFVALEVELSHLCLLLSPFPRRAAVEICCRSLRPLSLLPAASVLVRQSAFRVLSHAPRAIQHSATWCMSVDLVHSVVCLIHVCFVAFVVQCSHQCVSIPSMLCSVVVPLSSVFCSIDVSVYCFDYLLWRASHSWV